MLWCSHVEDSGLRVCDLILGLADNRVQPIVRMEEVVERLHVMQDEDREAVIELRALRSFAVRVWDLVLKRYDKASSLATSLSSTAVLIKGRVDVAAANGVHWGPD
jgi:hypothetical protein